MGLWYPKNFGFKLTAYSDVDHVGCLDTCKITLGGARFLIDKLVSWSSKKHDCTVVSTAEAEYVSLSACCAQMIWMRTQLLDYGFRFDKIPIGIPDYHCKCNSRAILLNLPCPKPCKIIVRMVQDEKDVIRFRIDQKQVDLFLNPFCTILQLPQAPTQKPFIRPTDFMTIEKFLKIVENEGGVPIAIKFAIKSLTQ
ncbi:hypothetical protein Tco_1110755 [Tanacetum coccineum]|uniref:Retrovirus-related Pol polyprotein from transposon TNT 1-94 n=1 Tax=Tanacetum coccineum TaxID=301880 RepID=A0ABQ5IJR9_9ASTR